ncbi:TolC family protein [Soonwooa sp.]|uniref:TolC family protein n=1 Tax=Soonwooa sp. TaxID=1938592 RepID=UPI002638CA10|nr:TolC family protein [Soonwooa sp.]
MKNKRISLGILLLISSNIFFQAQTKKNLSLNEAIDLGIKNSKSLKIDEAKVEEATANLLEAKNKQLPDFNVSGTYMYMPIKPNVNIKLPNMAGGAGPDVNQVMYGSANLSYPIFAGGRIKYGIESAKYLVEASKLSTENDKISVAYNIAQAYNNLFKASQAIKLLEESLTASQKRDQSFIKLEDNGVIARNDRLKAQLQTSNIEVQLLEAHNNYDIANINMDLLLGLADNTEIEIDPNYIEEQNLQDDTYYLTEAFKNRKDKQALEYQQKAATLGTKAAKAENLPTIALTGGYVAADIPKVLTVTNAVNFGVGVQYNLANIWKKNSNLGKSLAVEKQLEASSELLNDNITLNVKKDIQNEKLAYRKIDVYQRAVEQADENYRITKNKFDNGLATMTELLDADTAKLAAQVNLINSKADATLAHKKLLQTTGTIN